MTSRRIAFFNPHVGLFNERNVLAADVTAVPTIGRFTYRDEMTPPDSSLLFMAAIARELGWVPEYHDANVGGIPENMAGIDMAVILLTTHQARVGYRLAERLQNAGCRVALFGPHATALPEEGMAHADTVLCGEGESALHRWLVEGTDRIFPPGELISLDSLPSPDYSVLTSANHRVAPLLASRGCGRGCSFCWQVLTAGRSFRRRSVDRVLQDAEKLLDMHPGVPVLFMDDNMFHDQAHARAILEAIRPLGLRWSCQTDLTVAEDESLLDLAREAGCLRMLIGFESAAASSLEFDAPFKARTRELQSLALQRIQERGIGVVGSFIVGFDSDTLDTISETASFIDENIMANVSISILAPPPGTPLFLKLKRENRLQSMDWDDYNQCNVIFEPAALNRQELEDAARQLFKLAHSPEMQRRRVKYFLEQARRKG